MDGTPTVEAVPRRRGPSPRGFFPGDPRNAVDCRFATVRDPGTLMAITAGACGDERVFLRDIVVSHVDPSFRSSP